MVGDVAVAIRAESAQDYEDVRRVVAAAFESDVEAHLVDRIRASPEYVPDMALVAALGTEIVGHVVISHAVIRSDRGDRQISMLSPLAVLPAVQRKGVGIALVRAVLTVAEARGEPMVILEGNPDYYGRLGFEPAERYGIELPLPDWASPEAGQVLRLANFDAGDPTLRGAVIYPAAFDGLG